MKPRHLREFLASGIARELLRLNFATVDQEDAFALLTYAIPQAELRRNDGRLRDKYLRRFYQLEEGGWAIHGLDPDTHWTSPMEWGRLKPDIPRRDWDKETGTFKNKVVKYESPAKTPNRVTYLRVGLATWARVAERYGVKMPSCNISIDPETGEALGFWEWVQQHPQISIVLTEGEKKAAALLSRGYVAIALPGIYCGTIKQGYTCWKLHPDLVHLAQKGRNFYILFDYEPRADKARHIAKATVRLGKAIESEGSTCHIAALPGPEKGIDDWIVAVESRRSSTAAASIPHPRVALASLWVGLLLGFTDPITGQSTTVAVRDLLANALPLKTYCRLLTLPVAFARLTYKANLTVNERYISAHLPSNERLVALKAPKGTGKTYAIASYLDHHIRNFDGRRILVFSHRIQLGSALCESFGLPYLTDKASFNEGDVFGLGLCVNSLHEYSQARFKPSDWEDCIVIIDEIEQVLWHMLDSATCQRDRVEILSNFRQVIQNASQVVVADADLSDMSLDYLKKLIGCDPWLLKNTYQSEETAWDVTFYEGNKPDQLVLELTEAIAREEKPLVLTSSQKHQSKWSTRTLEKLLRGKFPQLRILRIDSESVADKTHPAFGAVGRLNELVPQYDLVLASPSIETGVSIDVRGHFTSVWAIATGVQTVFSVAQAMARLRDPVPRHVWISNRGSSVGDGSINAKQLLENIKRLAKGQRQYLKESENLKALWRGDFDGCEMEFQPLSVECWASVAARINAGALNYRQALVQLLEREGHRICRTGDIPSQGEEAAKFSRQVGECRDANYQQHRERVADPARYLESEEDFEVLESQIAMSEDERETVKHNQIARRYRVPVTPELVEKDDGGWYPKLQLDYYTGIGREFLNDACWRSFAAQSKSGAVFEPDFARRRLWAQVKLWEFLGLSDLENSKSILSQNDPIAAPIAQKCRDNHRQIKLILGVPVPPKGSDIQVLQSMFRTRGLHLARLAHKRDADGKLLRVYSGPVAAFLTDEEGKPIKDGEGRIIALSDGRERIFGEWREHHIELREKAIERLESERRAVSEATHTSIAEAIETPITREQLDTVIIGRPETVEAAIALSNPEKVPKPELTMPDWMELLRRINGFRKQLSHSAFVEFRARFGESLNTMSDCQLWRLLQELEQTFSFTSSLA